MISNDIVEARELTNNLAVSFLIIGISVFVLLVYASYNPKFDTTLEDNISKVTIIGDNDRVIKQGGLEILSNIPPNGKILSFVVNNPANTGELGSSQALYLTPMQSPFRIKSKNSVLLSDGDFDNNIPPKALDILYSLAPLETNPSMIVETRLSSLSGSHLVFMKRSGFGRYERLAITRFAKTFLTNTGNLTLAAAFLAFAAILFLSWLNMGKSKKLFFLMTATVFQSWIAMWFSREIYSILTDANYIHKISFVVYFLFFSAYGFFLRESATGKILNRVYLVFSTAGILAAVILVGSGLFCPLATGFQIYKYFLCLALLGYFAFAIMGTLSAWREKTKSSTFYVLLPTAAWIIAIGHGNDILRVYSLALSPYNLGPYSFFLALNLYMTNMAYYIYMHHQQTLIRERDNSRLVAIGELSAQVVHDIRSPLAALDAALRNTTQLPEKQRVIVRHAVNRIRDIANNLLEKNRQQTRGASAADFATGGHVAGESRDVYLLSSLMDPVITEKRLSFESKPGINIDFKLTPESYGLFARIQPVEFRRMISNLVNNAVEVLGDKGAVNVGLTHENGNIILTVADNGKGIPPEILAKLGQKGETHGKAGGSGLGLFHARTTAESWGGSLVITSELGKGTTVAIELPKAEAPAEFVPLLELAPGRPVVVLDDDASIHQVWQGRFESARVKEHDIEVINFSDPDKLREWVRRNTAKAEHAVYLFDYELVGCKETGLGLAEELGLCRRTILVTSRCEEDRIIKESKRLKMRMIPKGLASLVPITIQESTEEVKIITSAGPVDAVLVDDDVLVRMNWEASAELKGIKLKIFKDPAEFVAQAGQFPKETAIYLDSELGEDSEGGEIKGEDIAQDLHAKGFTNITLETGRLPEKFAHLPWLKVTDKDSPWS